jgi:ribosomal protein S18 acetylase RimI-like enzyme
MELSIGELREAEAEAAVALWREQNLTRPWNDPHDDLRFALGKPSSTVLAGRLGDRLVATVMLGHDGHRGWVYYLAVAGDCQKRGLGRAMMRAAEQWMTERGVPKLQLMVRADNAVALGFYATIGYERGDVVVLGRRLDS